jgi:hypothetical protein
MLKNKKYLLALSIELLADVLLPDQWSSTALMPYPQCRPFFSISCLTAVLPTLRGRAQRPPHSSLCFE